MFTTMYTMLPETYTQMQQNLYEISRDILVFKNI